MKKPEFETKIYDIVFQEKKRYLLAIIKNNINRSIVHISYGKNQQNLVE